MDGKVGSVHHGSEVLQNAKTQKVQEKSEWIGSSSSATKMPEVPTEWKRKCTCPFIRCPKKKSMGETSS